MNLGDIAALIGRRTGLVGQNDISACQQFLTLRHDQLWRSKLWKDSVVEYVVPIDPSAAYVPTSPYLPTKGQLILPPIISKVLAVRSAENAIDVVRPMLYYRADWDRFTLRGRPLEHFLLPSCVWAFDTAQNLMLIASNAADYGQIVTVDIGLDDGVSVMRVNAALSQFGATLGSTDLIEKEIKKATQGTVSFGQWSTLMTTTTNTLNNGPAVPGVVHVADTTGLIENQIVRIVGVDALSGVATVWTAIAKAILPTQFFATWQNAPGDAGPGLMAVNASVQEQATYSFAVLAAGDTAAPRCQRIRLQPIPSSATTLRVLGKRICPTFSDSTDVPAVEGFEQVLMPLAYYDMLHRDERGGTPEAQAALAESQTALGILENEEVIQAAHNSRIIPQDGFGFDDMIPFGQIGTKYW